MRFLLFFILTVSAVAETIEELEGKVAEVEARLGEIAHLSFRNGVGPIGYRTVDYETADIEERVRIQWGEDLEFDQVVIVPVVSRDAVNGYISDGFPAEFSIWTGNDEGEEEVMRFTEESDHLPRITPLVITERGKGKWLELRATKLSPRNYDGKFVLELAEILVFKGLENIALNAQVIAPKSAERSPARQPAHLTDGQLPYVMESGGGKGKALAYIGVPEQDQGAVLTVDLEQETSIDQIHLHAVETSDTIPQAEADGFGIPRHFVIEGSRSPTFTDSALLWEFKKDSTYKVGTMISKKLEGRSYRYLRLRVLKPDHVDERVSYRRVGFAEFQVFSQGVNVSLGKKFTSEGVRNDDEDYPLSGLTDGKNYYGAVLNQRTWLAQLSEREQLERALPMIKKRLAEMYLEQKLRLTRQIWFITLALASMIILALLGYLYKNRQITQIRQRFAADLHDELGANLHAIGILGELAKEDRYKPEKLEGTLEEIRRLTERTAASTRMTIDKQANPNAPDLGLNMRRINRRMMADIKWDLEIKGEEHLKHYRQGEMDDLYLFYKECLVNISRHSGATCIDSALEIMPKQIHLRVSDNGKGINNLPPSLARRAKLLRAKALCHSPEAGGTEITLSYKRPIFSL